MFFERYGLDDTELFRTQPFRLQQFPIHFHRAYELILVESGTLKMRIDGHEQTFNTGEAAFIFTNELHDIHIDGDTKIEIILFSPELVGDFHKAHKGLIPLCNKLILGQVPDMKLIANIYEKKRFLYDVCARTVKQFSFRQVNHSERSKVIYEMLLYVEENFYADFNLKVLAKDLRYDYAYLSKTFMHLMGMSFTEYLNHYRVSNAVYLLNNSTAPISDIAFKCGFNNFRTFNRNFKEIVGKSPTHYLNGG